MEKKPHVLFLCTKNACRSQMAEGFLRHLAGDRFDAFSAGLEPSAVHPLATRVMAEIGIDISGHRSKHVKELLGREEFRYVFFVCGHAAKNCPAIYPGLGERVYWPFDDPEDFEGGEEEKLARFRGTRDQIRDRIESWLSDMNNDRG